MSMHLTPEQEQLIQAKLDAGKYESAQAALDIALRLLNEYENAEAEWLESVRERVALIISESEDLPSLDGETFIQQLLDEKFHVGISHPSTGAYRINALTSRTLEEIADSFAFIDIYEGERFLCTFDETCRQLVISPRLGNRYDVLRPGLRGFRLSGHVVFYRIAEQGLEVVALASSHRLLASPLDESGLNSLGRD